MTNPKIMKVRAEALRKTEQTRTAFNRFTNYDILHGTETVSMSPLLTSSYVTHGAMRATDNPPEGPRGEITANTAERG